MAYLAFHEADGAPVCGAVAGPIATVEAERLTPLEWSVVALARRDGRRSLRTPGRLTTVLRRLLQRRDPRLANARLEALRRMAVLAWHDGYAVSSREVRAFLAAGFSPRQYETMVDHVSTARVLPSRTAAVAG